MRTPPKKPEALRLAPEAQVSYLLEITKEIVKSYKKGFSLQGLTLASSTIEESLLPHLTNKVLSRLGMIDKKKILSSEAFAIKNALYFALTQDIDMYMKLEKFRKIRNKIMHKVFSYSSLDEVNKEAIVGLKEFRDIVEGVVDRLEGKVPIPVLTYYPKGWNAAIKETKKVIKEMLS